jgi:hypothetical protein
MHIIGLTGPQGVGKDTVADLLEAHASFRKIAFADPLRAEVSEAFSVGLDALTDRATKEQPQERFALARCTDKAFIGALVTNVLVAQPHFDSTPDLPGLMNSPRSPRDIMRWWGTEYRRAQTENYWTSALVARINFINREHRTARFVIPDVRFDNEAELIRRLGGAIWQVKRPGVESGTAHVSEVDGEQFRPDAVINNVHDVRHLQGVVMAEWWAEESGLPEQDLRAAGAAMACRGAAC